MIKQQEKMDLVLAELAKRYPDAACELLHQNPFELLVAVMLSAQTSDQSVNRVTPSLFARYPTPDALAKARPEEIEPYIHSIGLYRNKARNLQKMAQQIMECYQGKVPALRKDLESLPGVGRKTANVVLAVAFKVPALAVDTHVERVSKRLGFLRQEATVLEVEKKLTKLIPRSHWAKAHHQLLFFGRYFCKAQRPLCEACPFRSFCCYLH